MVSPTFDERSKPLDGPERCVGRSERLRVVLSRFSPQEAWLTAKRIVVLPEVGARGIVSPESVRPRLKSGSGEHDVPLVHSGARRTPLYGRIATERDEDGQEKEQHHTEKQPGKG
jgi:hypothetical protein